MGLAKISGSMLLDFLTGAASYGLSASEPGDMHHR